MLPFVSISSLTKDFITTFLIMMLAHFATAQEDSVVVKGVLKTDMQSERFSGGKLIAFKGQEFSFQLDSLGGFTLTFPSTGKYELRFREENSMFYLPKMNYRVKQKQRKPLEITLKSYCFLNGEQAKIDIEEGKAQFVIFGGIAPPFISRYNPFTEKYGIKFRVYGCLVGIDRGCAIENNLAIAAWLDEKYGTAWRDDLIGYYPAGL